MRRKDQNNAIEPLSDCGEPVSFNQVRKMFRGKPVRDEPGRISMEGVLDECCTPIC
jgi:hypothetical protein